MPVKFGGNPSGDASELTFIAVDQRSPYTSLSDSEKAGQAAHYMLRRINTRSEHRQWSDALSAKTGA